MDYRSKSNALHVQEISEDPDSDHEGSIDETYLPSPAPAYGQWQQPQRQADQLPAFQSWDPDWVSGGLSSDQGFTTRRPAEGRNGSWEPASLPSLPDDTYTDPFETPRPSASWSESKRKDKKLVNGDGKGGNVSERKKEKRIRMLEEEFGEKQIADAEEGRHHRKRKPKRKHAVGDVTDKGKVVLGGSKKRMALRWMEGLLILSAIGAGPGIALLTNPTETPPPSAKLPTIALYIMSAVSLLSFSWLIILQPCCSSDRKDNHMNGLGLAGMNGYSALESSSGCCGGRKKKPKHGQPMNVNLILDESLLARVQQRQSYPDIEKGRQTPASYNSSKKNKRHTEEEDSDSGTESDQSAASSFHIPKVAKEDDVLEQAILEQQGSAKYSFANRQAKENARKRILKLTIYDGMMSVLWSALGVWSIGFGERCSPGSHQGWCDGYNSMLACAAFLMCCFLSSMVFGMRDLKTLKS